MRKILVTGARGFIGKNLINYLKNKGYTEIFQFDIDCDKALLDEYAKKCDFVFHLAGVNRPKDEKEFIKGNYGFTSELLQLLKKHKNRSTVLITSSIQAELDNSYGKSKKASEDLLFEYSKETGAKVLVYRLFNIFGKWCLPNYNSVVATFCHNIARDLEIKINSPEAILTLCYIDDVLEEFLSALSGKETRTGNFCSVKTLNKIPLGALADKLYSFRRNRYSLIMPSLKSKFDKALYATYLSYLPENNFSYKLKKNIDHRGYLSEFIKSESIGQIFISKTNSEVGS